MGLSNSTPLQLHWAATTVTDPGLIGVGTRVIEWGPSF